MRPVPLGEVVDIIMGQAPPSEACNFDGIGTPFVKVGEFGPLRPVLREWTTEPLKMARKTDVLLCVVGATCGKINLGEDCAIGRSVAAIRPKLEALDQQYLYYFLSTLILILRSGSQGAAQTVISREMIQSINIPLLPLAEQKRIVAILDEIFAGLVTATANAEKNLMNARELLKSHLDSVFERKGEEWTESPFEDCLVEVKYTTKIKRREFLAEGKFPIISQEAGFINGYWSKSKDAFKVTKPVVIFGDHTKVLKYVDFDFVLGADGVKILQPKTHLNPKFFYYALKSLALESKGYARHYSVLKAKSLFYPIDLKVQEAIASKLDKLTAECNHLEEIYRTHLGFYAELTRSILNKAFCGELTSPPSLVIKEAAE
jgi:type I restriction enzyme S subunit